MNYGDQTMDYQAEKLPDSVPGGCRFLGFTHTGVSLREGLGLPSDVQEKAATEKVFEDLMVTPDEAELLRANYAARNKIRNEGLRSEAQNIFGESFVGVHWVAAEGLYINLTAAPERGHLEALSEAVEDQESLLRIRLVPGGSPADDAETLSTSMTKNVRALNSSGYHSSVLDESCGHTLIYVTPGSDMDELSRLLEGVPRSSYSFMETIDSDAEDARSDHHNPYVGGSVVNLSGPNSGNCTTSIGWHKQSNEFWAVTAAHCMGTINPDPRNGVAYAMFTQQESWGQGPTQSLNDVRGLTTYAIYGGYLDVAVTWLDPEYTIVPTTIASVLGSGADQTVGMGWWQYDTTDQEAGPGYQGDQIAQSGINWNSPRQGLLGTRNYTWSGTSNITGLWSYFERLRGATYPSLGGDSGGTVWEIEPNGTRRLVGVHRGRSVGDQYGTYTHVSYIHDYFGLTAPAGMS